MLLNVLDLVGIAAFAVSGALAAVRARLDVFGVVVLGMITALGGGAIRDIVLGVHPLEVLRNWHWMLVAAVATLVVFRFHPQVAHLRRAVLVADAVGLGVFVTSGTATALDVGLAWYSACLVGMVTGIGGGVMRDVLVRQIPIVLRREIYALAALAGCLVVTLSLVVTSVPSSTFVVAGSVLVPAIRLLALHRHWDAPRPR